MSDHLTPCKLCRPDLYSLILCRQMLLKKWKASCVSRIDMRPRSTTSESTLRFPGFEQTWMRSNSLEPIASFRSAVVPPSTPPGYHILSARATWRRVPSPDCHTYNAQRCGVYGMKYLLMSFGGYPNFFCEGPTQDIPTMQVKR